jgi:hypothetical protein
MGFTWRLQSFEDHNRRFIKPIIEPIEDIISSRPNDFYLLDTAFAITDKMPEFIIDYDSINKLVNKKIEHLSTINDYSNEIVYVKIIVERDGIVEESEVTKGINTKIDQAINQAILDLELKFKPGEIQGHNVRTYLMLPIKIKTRPNNGEHAGPR